MNKLLPVWIIGLAVWMVSSAFSLAATLNPSNWEMRVYSQNLVPPPLVRVISTNDPPPSVGNALLAVFDKNPATSVILTNHAAYAKSPGVTINFGRTCSVHQVVIYGQNNGLITWPDSGGADHTLPLGMIVVYAGNSEQDMTPVSYYPIPYDAGNPIDQPMDIRFSPATCQYIKLEFQTRVNWPESPFSYNRFYGWTNVIPSVDRLWRIGELEIHGSANAVATDAVVLPANAPTPLALAAGELSYYLSELTGNPHPIITPDQTNRYSGMLYVINDLKPLAPDYATMMKNIAAGQLPAKEVNIGLNGRVVTFTGWPYRCVLWSVWEFLERQGVRWVFPGIHGDYVPQRSSIDFSMLPLTMESTAKSIYANWGGGMFNPWPAWVKQCQQQGSLYFYRSRWTVSCSPGPIGGDEIPLGPTTGSVASDYSEGVSGYPHNMSTVLPDRILKANPRWWGSLDGTNFSASNVQFNMASSNAAAWIAGKFQAWDAFQSRSRANPLSLSPLIDSYNILPVDAAQFSLDPDSVAANALYCGTNSTEAWISGTTYSSGVYYKLLSTIANICTNQTIGGLAYSDTFDPPKFNYPANVRMDVCLYGSPNLPFTSPANAGMKSALETWRQRCSKLAHYDYSLLFVDYWQPDPRVPVPMVTALVDRSRYLASIGAQNGGTQALLGAPDALASLKYNPWDFYAYPRTRWNTNLTAQQILNDFFTGYYQEAAAPMLAYYKAMEDSQYSNHVDLHYKGYCYWIMPGAFPLKVLNEMNTRLAEARSVATNWYVIDRINDARTAFDWLLPQCGVTNLAMLTDYSAYPTVPATGTYTVPMDRFTDYNVPRNYYYSAVWNEEGNQSWNFNNAGIIKQTLNFVKAGQYRVDVASRCKYSAGYYPSLRVFLGPSSSAPASAATIVSSLTMQTNSYVLTVSSPTALDLVLAQDKPGQFLQVASVKITMQ